MQYVVQVSGEVLDKRSKAYVINSKNSDEAKLMARENFCEDFLVETEDVIIKSDKRTYKAITAFVFMLIPILLSFVAWKNGHDTISISPDYLSCLYGTLIYASFIVRFKGIQRTVSSWIDILFCIFSILLISTFIKTILVTKTFSLLGIFEFQVNTNIVLPIAIILSWLGLKVVSLACIGFVTIMALFNISALNLAMGKIFGSAYIICSFVGIMLYLSVEPVLIEGFMQIRNNAKTGLHALSDDVAYAKSKAINAKESITKKISNYSEK